MSENIFNRGADIVKNVCRAFGVAYKGKPIPEPQKADTSESETYYRVVIGSFKSKEDAEKRMEELQRQGYNSFLIPFKK